MRPRKVDRSSLTNLIRQVDAQLETGVTSPDTVPTGFPSVDRLLGGGLRRRDLVVLGGDVGSGKSALALGFGLRAAQAGHRVAFFSGEMDEDRLLERALAIESRTRIDDMRRAALSDEARASVGAAAVRIRDLPIHFFTLSGEPFDEALAPAWRHEPSLVVVDYLQLLRAPSDRGTQDEECAGALRALKALALDRRVACLTVAQLPHHVAQRDDPRPTLDDFGALGAVKQHADVVLLIYREEMYHPGGGVEGATQLLAPKNRNGPTGFVDLYFYHHWLRFEDMLDPD
ncbi:MAG: AAA family ATPase [Gemmatimonadetes bacterium]|nr:AAA family ATPase [Gemmatimonadota bacterium]MBI2614682.1 AAA family ATPase [Gemmatimonadota bacterium]MBI3082577.1 AAA family ATPase [Gemmatimonadota bacterium]